MSALKPVPYRDGDVELTGWLARPKDNPRAAIVLYPTIANRTSAMDRRARMLADLGYLVLIADLYGVTPESSEHYTALATDLRQDCDRYRARIAAAIDALRDLSGDLPVAAIGYCLGGQCSLEAARAGHDLVLAVSFHGLLTTARAAEPGAIRSHLLVLHGDADPLVPRQQVSEFLEEMDRAGADWHFHSYAKVRHGFTDPASDERDLDAVSYDASADRHSWPALVGMLNEVLTVGASN